MPPDRTSPQNSDFSFDQLYAQAEEANPLLRDLGNKILADMRARYPGKFDDAYLEIAPTKRERGLQQKSKATTKGITQELLT